MNEPTPEERDAVYYALGEHWEEEMKEMLANRQAAGRYQTVIIYFTKRRIMTCQCQWSVLVLVL